MDLASDPDTPQENLVLRECGSLIVWSRGVGGELQAPRLAAYQQNPIHMVCMVWYGKYA